MVLKSFTAERDIAYLTFSETLLEHYIQKRLYARIKLSDADKTSDHFGLVFSSVADRLGYTYEELVELSLQGKVYMCRCCGALLVEVAENDHSPYLPIREQQNRTKEYLNTTLFPQSIADLNN